MLISFIVLVTITLAIMDLLVKLGAIKESAQIRVIKWLFSGIAWTFRRLLNLFVWLKIISPFKAEKILARTVNCFLDNLPAGFIIAATICVVAIIFGVTYLLNGSLPGITGEDWRAIGINLPIHYHLSRWFDLLCLGIWLFVNLSAYRVLRRTSWILFAKWNFKLFWRIFRNYFLLIFGALLGLLAVIFLGGAFYGLLINLLSLLAVKILEIIGRLTIGFFNPMWEIKK